jgi:hypothetical protein
MLTTTTTTTRATLLCFSDLLQMSFGGKPHVDVWMWTPLYEDEQRRIVTADTHVVYQRRLYSDVFPVSRGTWLGMNVTIPHDGGHRISNQEFTPYGGSYMTPLVVRGDCTHNLFNGRWNY